MLYVTTPLVAGMVGIGVGVIVSSLLGWFAGLLALIVVTVWALCVWAVFLEYLLARLEGRFPPRMPGVERKR